MADESSVVSGRGHGRFLLASKPDKKRWPLPPQVSARILLSSFLAILLLALFRHDGECARKDRLQSRSQNEALTIGMKASGPLEMKFSTPICTPFICSATLTTPSCR